MLTINGKRIHKVTSINMSVNGNDDLREPHIKITCWHDPRIEGNDDEVLDQFHYVRHISNHKEYIGYITIYLPIETEVHFKTGAEGENG